jgi:uncharacterized membrane protein YdjX (TVP38/TMEM64 family)
VDFKLISRQKAIRIGWKIIAAGKNFARRLSYRVHRGALCVLRLFFRIFRKYYSTILPMFLISTLYFFPEELKEIVMYFHVWGIAAMFLLCVVRCFSLIGFTVVGGSLSYLYNFHLGFAIFFFGSMTGAVAQYFAVARKWIRIPGESLLRKMPSPRSLVGVVLVRLCPLFPFDLVTIRLAYDRKITFVQFLRGTLLGSFPWFFSICLAVVPEKSEPLIHLAVVVGHILLTFGLLLIIALFFLVMIGRSA